MIKKLRALSEPKKIAIIVVVVGLAAVGMGYFWVKDAANSFSKIGQVDLPNIDLPNIDNIIPSTTDQIAGWETYRNDEYGFEFEYPKEAMMVLKESVTGQCQDGTQNSTSCVIFTSDIKNVVDMEYGETEIYYGAAVAVIKHPLTQEAIHKYDNYPLGGNPPVDVTAKMLIAGKEGYGYDLVSSVNYKIRGFMVPLSESSYVEISENSKYPKVSNDDWEKIISTFKFTK